MKFLLLPSFRAVDWKDDGEHPERIHVREFSTEIKGYKVAMTAFMPNNVVHGVTVRFHSPDARVIDIVTSNLIQVDRYFSQIKKYGRITES